MLRKGLVFLILMVLVDLASARLMPAFAFFSKPTAPQSEIKKKLSPHPAQTALSQKALQLKVGMTRQEVTALLGMPTWAQSYQGMPLDWMWKNGNCNPVDVTFDAKGLVTGYNEGRAHCSKSVYQKDLPNDQSLCSDAKNTSLCHS